MLKQNWFLTHTPAPGSERPYAPPRSFADAERALERLAARRSPEGSDSALRASQGAARHEARRLERAFA